MPTSKNTMEVTITRKGQVTIPAKIRRKLGLEKGRKLAIWLEDDKIIMKPIPTIFDLGGTGASKATPEKMKKMLDKLREEDI